jgi:hypothetical protein
MLLLKEEPSRVGGRGARGLRCQARKRHHRPLLERQAHRGHTFPFAAPPSRTCVRPAPALMPRFQCSPRFC